ncbi:MAG: hypothetical protein ABFE08_09045 [Armatimonadia bacterium]
MILPSPPERYTRGVEAERNRAIAAADRDNVKRGTDMDMDRGRVILRSPDGGRWALKVDNAGAVTAEEVA